MVGHIGMRRIVTVLVVLSQVYTTLSEDTTPPITELYPSVDSSTDWNSSSWFAGDRNLTHAYDVDPLDSRCTFHGNGVISISNGTLRMIDSPRYYVSTMPDQLWRNVEFTAYARLNPTFDFSKLSSVSGITLATRNKHDNYVENPCDAHGYYGKLWMQPGTVGIQKEFYHDSCGTMIYSNSNRNSVPVNQSSYTDKFFGIKFVVRDVSESTVMLQIYIDETEALNGGDWTLKHEYNDTQLAANWVGTFPCNYAYKPVNSSNSYAPVTRGSPTSFLRTTNSDLIWKWVSIREIPSILP